MRSPTQSRQTRPSKPRTPKPAPGQWKQRDWIDELLAQARRKPSK